MMRRVLSLARYAFVPFLPLLGYLQGEFGLEPITDNWILIGLAISVVFYIGSTKTIFHVLYFNFLTIWFCVGTANFIIYRLIWAGWEGDIITYNRLCALFLVTYSASAFFLTRRLDPRHIGPVTHVGIDLRLSARISLGMIALTAALIIPTLGLTGVFGGGVNDENRFDLEVSVLVQRLALAFPFLACILAHRLSRNEIRGRVVLGFIGLSLYLLSIFGARFGFFQTVITGFMFVVLAGRIDIVKQYRKGIYALVSVLIVIQLVLPALRRVEEAAVDVETLNAVTSFLRMWAGEHRDAAASFLILSNSEKEAIGENYVPSLLFPVLPSPVLSLFGVDKTGAMQGGASYYMQRAYSVEHGGIRIGGIAEVFFFLGELGVFLAGLANALAVWLIDRVAHRRTEKSFAAVAFAAYGSIWIIYFVASQNNMLLGPFIAFVVMYYVLVGVGRLLK